MKLLSRDMLNVVITLHNTFLPVDAKHVKDTGPWI
jgi:hypothetical protein